MKQVAADDVPFDALLLEAIEADLDANYHRIQMPHPNRAIATWYLLTALEDNLRGLFVLTDDSQAAIVEFQMDRQKYSVRFALDRIRKECTDMSQAILPVRVIPKLYLKTAALLMGGIDFMAASQLCSAAHAGTVRFKENCEKIDIVFNASQHDKRYAALELMGHMPLDVIDHSANLYAWARRAEFRPRIVDAIAQSVRISGQRVVYEYQPHLAVALAAEMMQQPFLVPDGWQFPWGGRYETLLLINAMCVRCMYHWIAVHFGAGQNGLRGGGEASILHVTTTSKLVLDLQEMCSLAETAIRSFVQYLTYGHAMKTPDPALQPIVALGNGLVGIPCLLFLSSNYERNLLGLQARIESAKFNVMSKLFESNMVRELLEEILPRWSLSKGNVTIRNGGEFEEMDLLVADPASRTLLVCELRWMLQPGDPREVQNRKKVCREKVDQLQRKVHWLRTRVATALSVLGLENSREEEWEVQGVVVIQTFGGTLSRSEEFPIMTARLFALGITQATSLRQFATWSQSLRWLPQENVHFRVVPQEVQLDVLGKRLVVSGIEKLCSVKAYTEFVTQSLLPVGR